MILFRCKHQKRPRKNYNLCQMNAKHAQALIHFIIDKNTIFNTVIFTLYLFLIILNYHTIFTNNTSCTIDSLLGLYSLFQFTITSFYSYHMPIIIIFYYIPIPTIYLFLLYTYSYYIPILTIYLFLLYTYSYYILNSYYVPILIIYYIDSKLIILSSRFLQVGLLSGSWVFGCFAASNRLAAPRIILISIFILYYIHYIQLYILYYLISLSFLEEVIPLIK